MPRETLMCDDYDKHIPKMVEHLRDPRRPFTDADVHTEVRVCFVDESGAPRWVQGPLQ